MTVATTPGSGGTRRRRFPVVVIPLLVIGILLVLWSGINKARADGGNTKQSTVSCKQLDKAAGKALVKLSELSRSDFTSGDVGKAQFDAAQARLNLKYHEAQKKAQACVDSTSTTVAGTPTTVAVQPPSGDCYTKPAFAANGRTDHRFGDNPVTISGPQDVGKVVQAKIDAYCVDPFQVAKDSQNDYLGNPGIDTAEVQGLANSYVDNHAKWEHDAKILIARLGRATFELKRTNDAYHTEEAIPSSDPSRAPAAKDADSHGERWVLVIHASAKDGGRTTEEVVDCFFQKHETKEAPPATPVTPTRPPTQTTSPPVTSPPPTVPPTTPSTTTTVVVTTTTMPDKPHGGGKPSE